MFKRSAICAWWKFTSLSSTAGLQDVKGQRDFGCYEQRSWHYRAVSKKYKCAKKVVNWSAAGSSVLSAAFSSTSFGSAVSVVGLPATIPLGGVGGAFALASSGLIITSKKLDSKIKKHQEIVTLEITKWDTVDRLLSKALADNQISDANFSWSWLNFRSTTCWKMLSGQNSLGSRLGQMLRRSRKMSAARWGRISKKITALATGSN